MSSRGGGGRGRSLDTRAARMLRTTLAVVEPRMRNRPTEMALVYDRYGHQIGEYFGNSDTTAVPTSEARYFAGGTFTHNHPAGGSFSAHDVAFAQQAGLAEMRVVTAQYVYSLRPPRGGWDHLETAFISSPADYLESLLQKWGSRLRVEYYSGRAMTQDEFNLTVTHRAMLDLARYTGLVYRRHRWQS